MLNLNTFFSYFFIPISFVYYEVVLKLISQQQIIFINFFASVLTCIAAGLFTDFLCSLFKKDLINKWIGAFILELIGIIYLISLFVFNTFKVFNDIETILGGANGVLTEFNDVFWSTIRSGIGVITLYEIPFIIYILLFIIFKKLNLKQINRKKVLLLLVSFVFFEGVGLGLMIRTDVYRMKLTRTYNFDLVAHTFNILTAYKLDTIYILFGNPFCNYFYETCTYLDSDNNDVSGYGLSKISFDLVKQTDNKDIERLNEYVFSQKNACKNEYTGIFEGKNIIFISAESLSDEAIRKDITPTLYRLKNNGINFTDYYQPYYNSSTATGEFANILGLIPTEGMKSYNSTIGKNLYFTIGNETLRKNYTNIAFHNGTLEYYHRYISHPNFGYPKFIAQGNGMETALSGSWPESDLEMFKYSIDKYIDKSPFCVYYMTLTPHFPYLKDQSIMTQKYGYMVENMGYSSFVEAYLTATIDFDKALEYLLQELEEKKLLDDTVIIISPDHYPYGLTEGSAFSTDKDYLPELYGFEPENEFERDHNALVIWAKSLEENEPIQVTEPVYSVDILPTLLNLFNLEYDSRLLAGRDVFSNALPLVIWPDYSWVTDKGIYFSNTNTFVATSNDVTDDYFDYIQKTVANKMNFSRMVIETDYYNYLLK